MNTAIHYNGDHRTPRRPSSRPNLAWRIVLRLVGVGKGAVAGSGLAIAILGIANVLVATFAHAQFHAFQFQDSALNILATIGAIVGAISVVVAGRKS